MEPRINPFSVLAEAPAHPFMAAEKMRAAARRIAEINSEAQEQAIRLAMAAVLAKLGETSIEITHEDVERVSHREIKIEQGRNGSCVLKIV